MSPRPRFRPVGLGFAARLAIATSGLIIGACLLLSWLLVRHDLAEIHRGLVDRGQTIVEYLAHDAELSVLSGDRTELRQLAEMARAQRDVLYCRFFDRDGEPLVAIGQPEGTPLPAEVSATTGPIAIGADVWEFRAPIFTTDLRPRREELEFFAGETAHAGEARQRVGTVTIGIALAPLRAHRRESFLAAVAFTGLVAFAASLIAVVWARAVTRPLQALARAADAIGQGSFGITVQVDTGDELAALAESFNEMAVSLAQSHSTVAEYSRTLEARTERLEAVNRELEEANHLKSEFLAQVSHELRTPLNVILGYTGMLIDEAVGPITDEQREMLVSIERYSKTQLDLIKNVLDLTRLASGKISFNVERFALPPMLADIVGLHELSARDRGVALDVMVADDIPELETDRVKLQEIVRNLVDNAMKFTSAGAVTVDGALAPGGEAIVIEVRDTGIGIPPDELAHIFDEFRQVGESSTRSTQGVGLGLSIVKRLATALGGTIGVTSTPGEGSTFRVSIPLVLRLDGAALAPADAKRAPAADGHPDRRAGTG